MASQLHVPTTFTTLRAKQHQPYELGLACAELLSLIPTLVSYHLDHPADYHNKPPKASTNTSEFAAAVDSYLRTARTADGVSEPFPDDLSVDRKQRKPRRKYRAKYIGALEKLVKGLIAEQLKGVFEGFGNDSARMFNKGVDFGLSAYVGTEYPVDNVVLEAGEGDWIAWLRKWQEGRMKALLRET